MVVQHNLTAMNANRYFGINNSKLSKSLEKLSSGYAINRAGDNAAGLAVSEKMRSQIGGLTQAVKNAQDGISMVQTYEGALTETDSILQRMKTLATQSANGSYDDPVDRNAIEQEFLQLNDELDQIADTDFNGVVVLNGGVMADGTRATNGVIDYTTTRASKALGASDFVLGDAKYAGTNNETVTFTASKDEATGKVTWKEDASALQAATSNDNGGFSYDGAVFAIDTTNVVTGDTVTVDFTKGSAQFAEGAKTAGYSVSDDKFAGILGAANAVDFAPGSDNMEELINALKGAEITLTYDKASGLVEAASLTMNGTPAATGAATAAAKYGIKVDGGAITISVWNADIATPASQDLFTIAAGTADKTLTDDATFKTTLAFADATFDPAKIGDVKIQKGSSVSTSDAYNNSEAKMTYAKNITLQVGARTKDAVNFTFEYASDAMGDLDADLNCTAKGLGTDKLTLSTQKDANAAIDKIDQAINKVSMVRGTFGAIQNRLEHKIDNLNVTTENLTSAESRIRDTNMAEEMMNFTKQQILSQASQSMLAQANQLPQGVLSLLQ